MPGLARRRSRHGGIIATWWTTSRGNGPSIKPSRAADEIAAALQAHLTEEHNADPERAAAQSTFTNSLKLLRQARERLGQALRAVEAGTIGESDEISLRNP